MTTRTATVNNQHGIHCRPAAVIAKQAQEYEAAIKVGNGEGPKMGAKNVLGLISLGLTRGQSVEIEVDGPHEERIADEMQALFEREFDFQR